MFGYSGTLLKVNLTTGDICKETFDADWARTFLGGNGFAAKIIADMVPPDAEPLSEENAVVFALGPLNGTTVWGTGRGHVAAISPQTGYFADSNFGGDFAAALKAAGVDAVVIVGKAPTPVYICLNDGHASLKAADDLWGQTTEATQQLLIEQEGKGVESAVIGPAGENGVRFAGIICSGKRISAAGRGGLGAVLGWKNCKAIAAKGTQTVEVADAERLGTLLKDRVKILRQNAKALTELGTPVLVNMINGKGRLGTRNNSRETFEFANDISGEVIRDEYKERNTACYRCPVACGKMVRVPRGEFHDQSVKMPEYESIYALGSMLENRDIVALFNANAMCDEMGVDTISMGVTIAFVAECLEKGLVTKDELGMEITFGDQSRLAELVRLTGRREGIGAILAQGSAKLAEKWGSEAEKLLYAVQGLEIAGHSARGIRAMGLGYATSTRGGSHHDTRPNYSEPDGDPGFDNQADYAIRSQNYTALGDSLVICRFVIEKGFGSPLDTFDSSMAEVVQAVTGWDLDLEELTTIGERIYNLERLINTRRGLNRSHDTLPYRVMHEPIADGPSKGRYCPEEQLQTLLDEYYHARGWDSNGIPTAEKLSQLEL